MSNKECKNCSNLINGEYCSSCGQKDIELLKFKELAKDFLDHHLDLDSRLFITLKYLLTKPGFLTNEYWIGRRKRYIPPFKIYLITSFLYFFTYSLIPNSEPVIEEDNQINIQFDEAIDKYEKEMELLLLLPLTALGLSLLNRKSKKLYFSHHFIASIHLSSAWFILQTIVEVIGGFFPDYASYIEFLNVISLVYCSLMIKNIYNNSLMIATIKSFLLIVLSVLMLIMILLTILTLNIIK